MYQPEHGTAEQASPTIPDPEPPTLPIRLRSAGRHREGSRPGMTSVRHWLDTRQLTPAGANR